LLLVPVITSHCCAQYRLLGKEERAFNISLVAHRDV
jgi:hypothetical protein